MMLVIMSQPDPISESKVKLGIVTSHLLEPIREKEIASRQDLGMTVMTTVNGTLEPLAIHTSMRKKMKKPPKNQKLSGNVAATANFKLKH